MTQDGRTQRPPTWAYAAAVGLLVFGGWALGLCSSSEPGERPGDVAVYARIEGLTDCPALQREFDLAMDSAEARSSDDPLWDVSMSYADAADERMSEVGCYSD